MNVNPFGSSSIYTNSTPSTMNANQSCGLRFGASSDDYDYYNSSVPKKKESFWQKWKKVIIGTFVTVGVGILGVVGYNKGWFSKAKNVATNGPSQTKPNNFKTALKTLGLSDSTIQDGTKIADLLKKPNEVNTSQFTEVVGAVKTALGTANDSSKAAAAVTILEQLRKNLANKNEKIGNFDLKSEINDIDVLNEILKEANQEKKVEAKEEEIQPEQPVQTVQTEQTEEPVQPVHPGQPVHPEEQVQTGVGVSVSTNPDDESRITIDPNDPNPIAIPSSATPQPEILTDAQKLEKAKEEVDEAIKKYYKCLNSGTLCLAISLHSVDNIFEKAKEFPELLINEDITKVLSNVFIKYKTKYDCWKPEYKEQMSSFLNKLLKACNDVGADKKKEVAESMKKLIETFEQYSVDSIDAKLLMPCLDSCFENYNKDIKKNIYTVKNLLTYVAKNKDLDKEIKKDYCQKWINKLIEVAKNKDCDCEIISGICSIVYNDVYKDNGVEIDNSKFINCLDSCFENYGKDDVVFRKYSSYYKIFCSVAKNKDLDKKTKKDYCQKWINKVIDVAKEQNCRTVSFVINSIECASHYIDIDLSQINELVNILLQSPEKPEKSDLKKIVSNLIDMSKNKKLNLKLETIKNISKFRTKKEDLIYNARLYNYVEKTDLQTLDEITLAKNCGQEDYKVAFAEYLIDLKIEKGCYSEFDSSCKKSLCDTIIEHIDFFDDNEKAIDNDIYNIAVIALKKLPDEGARKKFLNGFIQKLKTKTKGGTHHHTLGMLENLNKGNISQQLLCIDPFLKPMPKDIKTHYRLSRTTNRCVKLEDGMIGFKDTDLKAKSSLDEAQIKYLFGEQRSNYNQQDTGNCWLVSQLKLIEILPEYKLEVYKRFTMDDKNIIYILPNGRKITIPKDVLEKYMEQTHEEHLSPAMACLSLLATLFKNINDELAIIKEKGAFDDKTLLEEYSQHSFEWVQTYKDEIFEYCKNGKINIIPEKLDLDTLKLFFPPKKDNDPDNIYKDIHDQSAHGRGCVDFWPLVLQNKNSLLYSEKRNFDKLNSFDITRSINIVGIQDDKDNGHALASINGSFVIDPQSSNGVFNIKDIMELNECNKGIIWTNKNND